MIPVEQTILFGKEQDCFRACVASILEKQISEVPNFPYEFKHTWYSEFRRWLIPMRLSAILVLPHEELAPPLGLTILTTCFEDNDKLVHAVVCRDGIPVWDPSPRRGRKYGRRHFYTVFTCLDPKNLI